MPADAIATILADSPLHLWTMRESASGFSTFADEVSAANLPLSAGSGCTPAGWGNVAGYREVGGPQTLAPQFDGTANAYATTPNAVLGGRALGWGIVVWMDSTLTSLRGKTLYCERGTSGTDLLRFDMSAGADILQLTMGDDTAGNLKTSTTPTTDAAVRGGKGQFNNGGQMLGVSVGTDGKASFFRNGPFGIGQATVAQSTGHTWTNPGLSTHIGLDPLNTANAFNGTLCWVAVFGAAFTAAQFDNWYHALTPEPVGGAPWKRSVGGAMFPNSSYWNDRLSDTAPVDPSSSAILAQWLAYVSAHTLTQGVTPYVPMYNLDHATINAAKGVRTAFLVTQDQNNFMAGVPTPVPLVTGDPYPANLNSDGLAWCISPSTGLIFDVYAGFRLRAPSDPTPYSLLPPYITAATASTAGGAVPPGVYFVSVTSLNAAGGESHGPGGYAQDIKVTLGTTGEIVVSMYADLHGSPPPTHWNYYRRGPYPTAGPFGSTNDYQLMATLPSGTLAQGPNTNVFTDTGSLALDATRKPPVLMAGDTVNTWGNGGSALCSDPSSKGGGGSWDFLKNSAFYPVFKPSNAVNNGASASSSPVGAGVITVEEALAGLIQHPIVIAMPTGNQSQTIQGHQWPAPRHDGTNSATTGNQTMEGMRWRLPHTFDENTLTYSPVTQTATFQKAVVVAMRDYGLVIRDSGVSALLMYLEDTPQTGREAWRYVFGGYATATAGTSVLTPMPWSSLQVLMPFRYPSRADGSGRRTNRLDVSGKPTPVPY